MITIIYTALILTFFFVVLRIESYSLRQHIKQLDKEITKAFNTQKPTRYKPSKYLVISR